LVMNFFKDLKGRPNERGETFTPQTGELFNCGDGGWKAIGYSLMDTSPANVAGEVWGKKRIVSASQGPQAVADFDAWFYAGIEEGLVPIWRYYVSHGRCVMRNSEFKNVIVYRHDTKDGSVLVEFVPSVGAGKVDMTLLAEVLSEEMNVKSAAEQFLLLSQAIGLGANVLWTYSGDRDAA
jgi:hypothetical protein